MILQNVRKWFNSLNPMGEALRGNNLEINFNELPPVQLASGQVEGGEDPDNPLFKITTVPVQRMTAPIAGKTEKEIAVSLLGLVGAYIASRLAEVPDMMEATWKDSQDLLQINKFYGPYL